MSRFLYCIMNYFITNLSLFYNLLKKSELCLQFNIISQSGGNLIGLYLYLQS